MKKTLILTLAIALVLGNAFFLFEGAVALAGTVTSTATTTGAGNTISLSYNDELNVDPEMSLTCETTTPVSLAPNILGITGGTATGNRACTAITNNFTGYTMQGAVTALTHTQDAGHSFSAYAGATSSWAAVGAGNSGFGFKTTLTGWISGGPTTIASSAAHTSISGDSVTVDYEAEIGAGSMMPSGTYQATSTISLYMN